MLVDSVAVQIDSPRGVEHQRTHGFRSRRSHQRTRTKLRQPLLAGRHQQVDDLLTIGIEQSFFTQSPEIDTDVTLSYGAAREGSRQQNRPVRFLASELGDGPREMHIERRKQLAPDPSAELVAAHRFALR